MGLSRVPYEGVRGAPARVATASTEQLPLAECDALRAAYKSAACKGELTDKIVLVDGITVTCGALKERFHMGGCPCTE